MRLFWSILSLVLVFLLLQFSACRRNLVDNSLGRTDETMRKFVELLTNAENGWNVCVKDKKGNVYHFWMKFDANDRVQMKAAGFPFEYEAEKIQSADYVIRDLQQPTLTFATYTYISKLADPDQLAGTGAPGTGYQVDIQYAFSANLVESLKRNTELAEFSLAGRLHGSVAYFSKIEQGEISAADKVINITHYLDALRWQKGNSVNIVIGLDNPENTWVYDLQTTAESAAIHPQSIAFTNLQKRIGAVFHYYYYCEGNLRLKSGGDDVPYRYSYYDSIFETRMINSVYKDFQLNDSTKLNFTQYEFDGQVHNLSFGQENITSIIKSAPDLQDNYQSDSSLLYTYDFYFRGFTKRNIRDIWKTSTGAIPGAIGYVWNMKKLSAIGLNKKQDFGDSTVSQINILAGLGRRMYFNNDIQKGKCKGQNSVNNSNLGQDLAYFKFDTLKRGFFGGVGFAHGIDTPNVKWGKDYPQLLGEAAYKGVKEMVLGNCFVMLPTVLGFEFHRMECKSQKTDEPSGLVIPLYLQYWADEVDGSSDFDFDFFNY